jgi:hypothetical protein
MRSVSVRRGVALLTFLAVCLIPIAGFADSGEISVPHGAAVASQASSAEAKIQPPIGFWDVVLLMWLEAKIGPPGG